MGRGNHRKYDTFIFVFKDLLTQSGDELITQSGDTLNAGIGSMDWLGTRASVGEYELSSLLDLGGKFGVNLQSVI